ncbi:collagen-like protein [Lactiplantibacillus plantarum]|uniref:collagen-like protein n=1 Tax=Lactiplantibacillus plantarum TaxID=1590 RepID=UPI00112873AA|nr:collagen-like protein [Lactiplantibacillus plantarum]TPV67381.1 collagen-like protein [Lactiplantibacillus plantarum]
MEKTLSFTDTSSQTVKIGDTTTSFTLVCGNDNTAVDLTHATSITVKLGNASGYLKSTKIEPSKLTDPTNGKITVTFDADLMKSLPAGNCAIEVWVVDSTGTSIYPSDGSTGFTITNNIQSTTGEVITTIAFDEFVKAMNKAASTIAKGDKGEKGDTGTVDNAGLTTASAFVNLQTQVNNSAVGTNLLTNLPSNWAQEWITSGTIGTPPTFKSSNFRVRTLQTISVSSNSPYTISISDTLLKFSWLELDSNGNIIYPGSWITSVNYTFTTAIKTTQLYIVVAYKNEAEINTSNFPKIKLEKGSVATDWCPNPAEVLTQADYAKLKAAIVSLGGHLS